MHLADYTEIKQQVAAALRDLEHTLGRFIDTLSHDAALVSAEGATSDRDALRRICGAYATIDYGQDDAANESPLCLGVVGVSAAVVKQAADLNAVKSALRERLKVLRPHRVRVPVKDGQGGRIVKSLPLVRVILRELQRSDLNVLAAYRKVPVLTGRVARVAYTRALTRAVYRLPRSDIATMLLDSTRPSAAEDLERLRQLPARETHLALVKERYTNVRANVWFAGVDNRNRGRAMISAELPLLYPVGRSRQLPEIRYPDAEQHAPPAGKPRTGKLEPAPFLDSLPVYRYRPAPRRR